MFHKAVENLVEPQKDWNDVDNETADWVYMVVVENHGRNEMEGNLDIASCSHFVVLEILSLRLKSSTNFWSHQ
jgi:hypothetical protein